MRAKRSRNQKSSHSHERTTEKASFLAHSDIFRHLNTEDINELERITAVITCPPGRVFYRPGERGTTLYLLNSGRVQLYHLSTDGRKLIISIVGVGESFGEMLLLGQDSHTCFAEAVEDACVYVLNKQDIEQLLHRKPAIALALLQKVGQRLARLETQLIDTTFKSTSARLAALLLQLASGQNGQEQTLVIDGLSQEELAERLGVYRETVSTALRDLRGAGAIEPGRKHITISDLTQLQAIAGSGEKGTQSI